MLAVSVTQTILHASQKLAFMSGGAAGKKVAEYLIVLVSLWTLYHLVSVDIIARTTNDSVIYLRHALGFREFGLVAEGYRQFGYPLFLRICHELAGLTPFDGLFMAVLVQRILLAIGFAFLIATLRLFAIPLMFVLAAPLSMALTDSLYPEGLLISLAIMFACFVLLAWRAALKHGFSKQFTVAFLAASFLYGSIVIVKLQAAAYGLLLPALIGTAVASSGVNWKSFRAVTAFIQKPQVVAPAVILAVVTIALFSFLVLLSLENKREHGIAKPVVNVERSAFAGAWFIVFRYYEENRKREDLAEYFDSGTLFKFLHGLECRNVPEGETCQKRSLAEREEILRARSKEMIAAAGLSEASQRWKSALATLYGGRLDDQGGGLKLLLRRAHACGANNPVMLIGNWYTDRHGVPAFLKAFNRGETPHMISGFGYPEWLNTHPTKRQNLFMPLLLIMIGLSFAAKDFRLMAGATLAAFAIFAAAAGYYYADMWRYVLPSWIIFAVIFSFGARFAVLDLLSRRANREHPSSRSSSSVPETTS